MPHISLLDDHQSRAVTKNSSLTPWSYYFDPELGHNVSSVIPRKYKVTVSTCAQVTLTMAL